MENRKKIALIYHNIVKDPQDETLYGLSQKRFLSHLDLVCKQMENKQRQYDIVFTFDDGFSSWADFVLPLLKERNMQAYFFVAIRNIEEKKISNDQVKFLYDQNMFIGSHSLSHCYMHEQPPAQITHELKLSKQMLEEIISGVIDKFAVPYGLYNRNLISIAKQIGYIKIFTSEPGVFDDSQFLCPRISITREVSLEEFSYIVNGELIRNIRISRFFINCFKKIFGVENYNSIKRMLFKKVDER